MARAKNNKENNDGTTKSDRSIQAMGKEKMGKAKVNKGLPGDEEELGRGNLTMELGEWC